MNFLTKKIATLLVSTSLVIGCSLITNHSTLVSRASSGYQSSYETVTTVNSSQTISELTSNDEYQVRDSFYSLTDSTVNRMTSEHFQIIWGNDDTTGTVTTEFIKGNLINLENIRAFYINELGMKDICYSMTDSIDGKYKTNIYVSATGLTAFTDDWAYMSTDSQGFAYLFVAPGAMRVDEPSWVIPHELAHAFTYHQGGSTPGSWYEAVANFFRDQYLGSTYYAYGDNVYGPTSDFFGPYIIYGDYYAPHMLNWYDTWPIFLYIKENPDNIDGLGLQVIQDLMQKGNDADCMYDQIEDFSGVSIKTILGGMARRLATMDFERQSSYLEHLNDEVLTVDGNYDKIYTTLEVADSEGYQSVPSSKAPMQGGFNIIPLDADFTAKYINIDFVNNSGVEGSDFRVSIVTETKDHLTRYSDMISEGNASIELNGDETNAYLVVCATPDEMQDFYVDWNSSSTDTSTRYSYKVKITYDDENNSSDSSTNKDTEKDSEIDSDTSNSKSSTPDDYSSVNDSSDNDSSDNDSSDNDSSDNESSTSDDNYLSTSLSIPSDWGNGAVFNLTVTNNSSISYTDGWTLQLDSNRPITQVWGGILTVIDDDTYQVTNPSWNEYWASGESITISGMMGSGSETVISNAIIVSDN